MSTRTSKYVYLRTTLHDIDNWAQSSGPLFRIVEDSGASKLENRIKNYSLENSSHVYAVDVNSMYIDTPARNHTIQCRLSLAASQLPYSDRHESKVVVTGVQKNRTRRQGGEASREVVFLQSRPLEGLPHRNYACPF